MLVSLCMGVHLFVSCRPSYCAACVQKFVMAVGVLHFKKLGTFQRPPLVNPKYISSLDRCGGCNPFPLRRELWRRCSPICTTSVRRSFFKCDCTLIDRRNGLKWMQDYAHVVQFPVLIWRKPAIIILEELRSVPRGMRPRDLVSRFGLKVETDLLLGMILFVLPRRIPCHNHIIQMQEEQNLVDCDDPSTILLYRGAR